MGEHVVIGAGQVGSQVVRTLAGRGHEVVVVSRSGSGPDLPGVRRVAASAADREALTKIAAGADALYNCVNPPYHRWMTDWPPMAAAMLAAAEESGAVYVILGNLYVYAPPTGPLTEDLPLDPPAEKGAVRARMWRDALAAHEAGRVRATELRGSDFYGPGCRDQSHLGDRFMPLILAGKRVRVVGDPTRPHSWTYVDDVATALVTAAGDERAWGRAWHIPTAPPKSFHELAGLVRELSGCPAPRVSSIPQRLIDAMGLFSPMLREIRHVRYQYDRPFVVDSSAFTETFGIAPTPAEEALEATIAWWRSRDARG